MLEYLVVKIVMKWTKLAKDHAQLHSVVLLALLLEMYVALMSAIESALTAG